MPHQSKIIELYCQNLKSMPMSIYILGELMMIATKRDFSLITHENHKFEILRHPESFRSSVVQVFIMGYKAFQNAQISMSTIARDIKLMPIFMTEIQKLSFSGYKNKAKLESVERIAENCINLSSKWAYLVKL